MATEADMNWLRSEWTQLFSSLGADAEASRQAFADLVEHYSSRGRYYHTLAHIQHVLQTIHMLKDEARDLSAVLLAGWYHDVIYDSKAKDNEETSAAYAAEALGRLGVGEERVRRVGELILMTKTHEAPVDDMDTTVVLDADLAILGAPPANYDQYSRQIRQEYAWVPEDDYLPGREKVLRRFFMRERIYGTEIMFEKSERLAHRNLRREVDWKSLSHPGLLLTALGHCATERKLRLFACACYRSVWPVLEDLLRRVVKISERYADTLATSQELEAARRTVLCFAADESAWTAANLAWHAAKARKEVPRDDEHVERDQSAIVRDIFANPFRTHDIEPAWLSSNVVGLAKSIYDERAFERMPILADALEDAGCDNADILEHCRQPGEHVRGCWVVDLILGKS